MKLGRKIPCMVMEVRMCKVKLGNSVQSNGVEKVFSGEGSDEGRLKGCEVR